jgi:ABC-2 type transport system permease protein
VTDEDVAGVQHDSGSRGAGSRAPDPPLSEAAFPAGTFTPRPGRATPIAMALAAARQELRITLRNGEQLLLAVVIPLAALLGMTLVPIGGIDDPRVDTVTPGVLALAVMSSAFTSQAITTGFDRRYGVLKRLAATGFPRWLLLAAKCGATLAVVAGQIALLCLVAALALGWHPVGNPGWAVLLVLLGVAAFVGLALLLGGSLRAEAVLGLANLVWLVLLGIGGVLIPLSSAPDWLRVVGELTPAGALSSGLRDVLSGGHAPTATCVIVLVVWVLIGWLGTVRWFRWQ